MSGSRIKSIAITALVLVNAFFLAIIIIDTYADARDERQSIENACVVLQLNGIEIDPDNVKAVGAIQTMRTARGVELEATIASALLGAVEMTDQSVIFQYENTQRGTAKFYSGGDFEIQLYEGVISSNDSTLKTVRELLRNMKLDAAVTGVSNIPEGERVTAINTYKGAGILNCAIDFIFSGGDIRSVTGRYVTGIEPMDDGVSISRVGTALLRFLAAKKAGEVDCKTITDVEAGYYYSVVGSFGGVINPVWLITTETGQYIIDSATGEIRAYQG